MTLLARAAVGGFGAAAGRDAYRAVKKRAALIITLAVVAAGIVLPFLGGRELVRGHDRGILLTFLITLAGSIGLVAAGAIAAIAVDLILQSVGTSNNAQPVDPRIGEIGLMVGSAFIVGLLVGVAERGRRLARFSIQRENEQFLLNHGIRDTGGDEVTHRDAQNTPLRLLETTRDSIVFMVVGRRGKRAFIHLAQDGRMVEYSGALQ